MVDDSNTDIRKGPKSVDEIYEEENPNPKSEAEQLRQRQDRKAGFETHDQKDHTG